MRYGIVNKLYEIVYQLKCKGYFGFSFLSNVMLKVADPIIKTRINSQECYIHFSHQGVYYMCKFPNYDVNLGKICSYIKEKYNRKLFIVDIGANVGDTILCIGDRDNYYLAVEGEARYYSLLRTNLKGYKYRLIKSYCGEKDNTQVFSIDYKDGTGKLVVNNGGEKCRVRTLDSILKGVSRNIDFVKIDTDGFDFSILRGMKDTLINKKPVVYFEWTGPELLHNNEDLLSAFIQLKGSGYDRGIVFDNYGNFLCSIKTKELKLLRQLIDYSIDAGIYYDVCMFHESCSIDINDLIGRFWRK